MGACRVHADATVKGALASRHGRVLVFLLVIQVQKRFADAIHNKK
jgi:hypothetical protein